MDADHTRKGVVTSSAMSRVAALVPALTPASTSVPSFQHRACFHKKKFRFKFCFFLSS
jgi:hypothetical protein